MQAIYIAHFLDLPASVHWEGREAPRSEMLRPASHIPPSLLIVTYVIVKQGGTSERSNVELLWSQGYLGWHKIAQ